MKKEKLKEMLITIASRDCNVCPDDYDLTAKCNQGIEDGDCEKCWRDALEKAEEVKK